VRQTIVSATQRDFDSKSNQRMSTKFTAVATEIVKSALKADKEGKLMEALELYLKSIDFMHTGLKNEQGQSREMVQERLDVYKIRAEAIARILSTQSEQV